MFHTVFIICGWGWGGGGGGWSLLNAMAGKNFQKCNLSTLPCTIKHGKIGIENLFKISFRRRRDVIVTKRKLVDAKQ